MLNIEDIYVEFLLSLEQKGIDATAYYPERVNGLPFKSLLVVLVKAINEELRIRDDAKNIEKNLCKRSKI